MSMFSKYLQNTTTKNHVTSPALKGITERLDPRSKPGMTKCVFFYDRQVLYKARPLNNNSVECALLKKLQSLARGFKLLA